MPDWFLHFPEKIHINIVDPIDKAIHYMLINWDPFFDGLKKVMGSFINAIGSVVNLIPWWLMIIVVAFLTYSMTKKVSRSIAYALLLFFIGTLGLWDLMYQTLTIIIASVIVSLAIGFPFGILVASSKKADAIVRPILDTMQTMPSFVYLIPVVMFLGTGNISALLATTIYAVPPAIRLTSHGIQQVNSEVVEAAKAFGSTKSQTLFKVQIPQAMPTIMTGVNQTIMMAVAMVVTSSMIGARGLGSEVMIGLNRLESGRGFAAGIAIVIIAIVMDRMTQGMYKKKEQETL